jgi:excisionase family DNA binding protein
MTTRQYLTVEQLAKIWQISKRTIYRMIDSGELSARKFGRSIRIDPEVAMHSGRTSSVKKSKPRIVSVQPSSNRGALND